MGAAPHRAYPDSVRAEDIVREILSRADVVVNGHRPWDLRVRDERFYQRVIERGGAVARVCYGDGWWDVPRLDQFFERMFRAELAPRESDGLRTRLALAWARVFRSRPSRRRRVDDALGGLSDDELSVLREPDEIDDGAFEVLSRKLELRAGLRVLIHAADGRRAFAGYAAQRHGVEAVSTDPESSRGEFDRLLVLGELERLDERGRRRVLAAAAERLKPDGLALFEFRVRNASCSRRDPWFGAENQRGRAPTLAELASELQRRFVVEDCRDVGPRCDPALMSRQRRMERAWAGLKEKYDERLRRLVKYDLLCSAGAFRSRWSQMFQLVATKPGRSAADRRRDQDASAESADLAG